MHLVAQHTLERKSYFFQLALYASADEKKYALVRCWGPKIIFYTGTLTNHGRHQPYMVEGTTKLITTYNRILRKRRRSGYRLVDTPRYILRSNPTARAAFVTSNSLLKKDPYGKFINLGTPSKSSATLSNF